MFDITFPRNGALLNHRDGVENNGTLKICVRGIYDSQGEITVNNLPVRRCGREFNCDRAEAFIHLRRRSNDIF